jgi:hypothetical protein
MPSDLSALLNAHPALLSQPLENVLCFVMVTSRLKNDILLAQPSRHPVLQPPEFLPPSVVAFLTHSCGLDEPTVGQAWQILRDIVWRESVSFSSQEALEDIFRAHGHQFGFRAPHFTSLKFVI